MGALEQGHRKILARVASSGELAGDNQIAGKSHAFLQERI
jgi:hypothetical protein